MNSESKPTPNNSNGYFSFKLWFLWDFIKLEKSLTYCDLYLKLIGFDHHHLQVPVLWPIISISGKISFKSLCKFGSDFAEMLMNPGYHLNPCGEPWRENADYSSWILLILVPSSGRIWKYMILEFGFITRLTRARSHLPCPMLCLTVASAPEWGGNN